MCGSVLVIYAYCKDIVKHFCKRSISKSHCIWLTDTFSIHMTARQLQMSVGCPAITGQDITREQQKSGNVSLKCHMQINDNVTMIKTRR